MPFIIRGVRMFSGWPDEEAPEGGLRRVHRLCGLTLGGDDLLDGSDFTGQHADQRLQRIHHIRIATLDGKRIEPANHAISSDGINQSLCLGSRKLPR